MCQIYVADEVAEGIKDPSYDARNRVQENLKSEVDSIMAFFPEILYSPKIMAIIRAGIETTIRRKMTEYKDAFCEDHGLCPMCITGGWNCGSDHK